MMMNMDRNIFNLKASVYATSLYILICALMDEGEIPTLDGIRPQWNATDEHLADAVAELTRRGILEPIPVLERHHSLQVNPSTKWHRGV